MVLFVFYIATYIYGEGTSEVVLFWIIQEICLASKLLLIYTAKCSLR